MVKMTESTVMSEYMATHMLERRLAAIDNRYNAFVTNRAFCDYFEVSRILRLIDFVHSDEIERFKEFFISYDGGIAVDIFRFRFKDGSYRYNQLKIFKENEKISESNCDAELEKDIFNIEMIDIDSLEKENEYLVSDELELRTLFGMNEEYTFSYNRENQMFCLYRYETLQKVVIYKMNIDDWKAVMIKNGQILENDIGLFNEFINYMKNYETEFSVAFNSNIRTKNEIFEKLRFDGKLFNSAREDHIIIGRMFTEDSNQKVSRELIDELQFDSLTGVYNKKTITDYAKSALKNEKKNRVTIVILDVDHFKNVNDTYGHLFGDKILKRVGNCLRVLVGEDGVVGRIGGDEFMIVYNGINDDTVLRGRLRALRTQIKWEFANDFEDVHITASIGASIYPNNGTEYEELFKKADYCLYIAKEKGRDRYVFFRDELHRKSFEESLNKKISNGQTSSRQILEIKFMSSVMQKMSDRPKEALTECMQHMCDTFNLDSINIFGGPELKRMYTFGKTLENSDDAQYAKSPEFFKMLKGKKYVQIGFVASLYNDAPEFCNIMKKRGVFSTVQCIIGDVSDIKGVITFDKEKESSQWAEYEINCAVIFSSFIDVMLRKSDVFMI